MKHSLFSSIILVLTLNLITHYSFDELQISVFADDFPLDDDIDTPVCPCCKDKENHFFPNNVKLDYSDLQRYSCHDLFQVMFPIRSDTTVSEKQIVLIYKEFNRRAKLQPLPIYVNENKSECYACEYTGFYFYLNIDMMDCAIVSEDLPRVKELFDHGYGRMRTDQKAELCDLLALALYFSNEEILDYILSQKQTFDTDLIGSRLYLPFSHFDRRSNFPIFRHFPQSHVLDVAAQYSNLICFKKILKYILISNQKYKSVVLNDVWQDSHYLSWIDRSEKCNKQDIYACVFLKESQPLTFAIYGNNSEIIKFIVTTELQDPGSGIPIAIEMKNMIILKYLVKHANNLNLKCPVLRNETYKFEKIGISKYMVENGLHQFIRQNNFKGVKWIVKNGFVIYDYDLRIWVQNGHLLDLTLNKNEDSYVWYTIKYTDNVEMLAYFLDYPDVVQSRCSDHLLSELEDFPELISLAAVCHHVNILKYLCNRYKDKMSLQQYEFFMRKADE